MKYSLLLFVIVSIANCISLNAQCYESIVRKGIECLDIFDFDCALAQFNAAEICEDRPSNTNEIDSLINFTKDGYLNEILKANELNTWQLNNMERIFEILEYQSKALNLLSKAEPEVNLRVLNKDQENSIVTGYVVCSNCENYYEPVPGIEIKSSSSLPVTSDKEGKFSINISGEQGDRFRISVNSDKYSAVNPTEKLFVSGGENVIIYVENDEIKKLKEEAIFSIFRSLIEKHYLSLIADVESDQSKLDLIIKYGRINADKSETVKNVSRKLYEKMDSELYSTFVIAKKLSSLPGNINEKDAYNLDLPRGLDSYLNNVQFQISSPPIMFNNFQSGF